MKIIIKSLLVLTLFFNSLSGFSQDKKYMKGCIIDTNFFERVNSLNRYRTTSINDDGNVSFPKQKSLSAFAPKVADQGNFGTCVGWSTAYYAGSILYNLTMNDTNSKMAFSALYLYNSLKEDDGGCDQGQYIHKALNYMKYRGMLPRKDYQDFCALESNKDTSYLLDKSLSYRIKDYISLSKDQLDLRIKRAISRNHPVIIGIYTPSSLESNLNGEVWDGIFDYNRGGHALCLVGYDDDKEGGSFEIMNSWGAKWGINGKFWVRYEDMHKLIKEAYEIIGYNTSELAELKNRYNYNVSIVAMNEAGEKLKLDKDYVSDRSYKYAFSEFGTDVLKPYFLKYDLRDSSKTGAFNFRFKLTNKDSSYVYVFNHSDGKISQFLSPNGVIPSFSKTKVDMLMPQSGYIKIPEVEESAWSNKQELDLVFLYSKKLIDPDYLDEILNDKYYYPEDFVLKNFKHQMNCKPIRNIDDNFNQIEGYFSSSDNYGVKNSPGSIMPVIIHCSINKFHEVDKSKKSKHKKNRKSYKKKRFKWLRKKKSSDWDFEFLY
jgi:C1A family cysteine protease